MKLSKVLKLVNLKLRNSRNDKNADISKMKIVIPNFFDKNVLYILV